jgi:uncharacterized membrane protein
VHQLLTLILLPSPRRLIAAAKATGNITSVLLGALAMAAIVAFVPALLAVHISEPYGNLAEPLSIFARQWIAAFIIISGIIAATGIAFRFSPLPKEPATRILFLSPLAILLPYTIWAALSLIDALATEIVVVGIMPRWTSTWPIQIAGSCLWIPLWAIAWFAMLSITIGRHISLADPGRCIACDYDLAGLPADATCPECGARRDPPSPEPPPSVSI